MFLSNQTYRVIPILAIALCLLLPFRAHAGQGDDIPLAARMALYKAQQLVKKEKVSEAVGVLESFRATCGKNMKPGARDSKGCAHHLPDFNLGNYYLMTERLTKAASRYRSAVKKKPDFHAGWMNLAKCLHDMNQPGEAGKAFLKGYETSPEKKAETLYYAGACFTSAGDHATAVETFGRLLSLHRSEARLEWKEAFVHACLSVDKPRRALPVMEELARKAEGEKKEQWQEALLYQYMSLNMKKKALGYVEKLTRERPLEPRWWKGLAHLHLKENRYRSALVALTVKGFISPLTERELEIVADLNAVLGIPIQSARHYEKMLKKQFDLGTIFKIARSYQYLHRPDEALAWVQKGIDQKGATPHLTVLKGDLLYEMKRHEEAIDAFEAAARHPKNAGRAWLMVAWSAWSLGDHDRARKALEKASKIPTSRRAAKKALAQLGKDHPRQEKK